MPTTLSEDQGMRAFAPFTGLYKGITFLRELDAFAGDIELDIGTDSIDIRVATGETIWEGSVHEATVSYMTVEELLQNSSTRNDQIGRYTGFHFDELQLVFMEHRNNPHNHWLYIDLGGYGDGRLHPDTPRGRRWNYGINALFRSVVGGSNIARFAHDGHTPPVGFMEKINPIKWATPHVARYFARKRAETKQAEAIRELISPQNEN